MLMHVGAKNIGLRGKDANAGVPYQNYETTNKTNRRLGTLTVTA